MKVHPMNTVGGDSSNEGANKAVAASQQQQISGLPLFFRQIFYLCKKSFILQTRYRITTFIQIFLAPFIVMLLLYFLQVALGNSSANLFQTPAAQVLEPVPVCQPAFKTSNPCITVMYAPSGDAQFEEIMQKFVQLNDIRHGSSGRLKFGVDSSWTPTLDGQPTGRLGVVAVPNEQFIYSFVEKFPNSTSFGINFGRTVNAQGKNVIQYQLWYNFTDTATKYRVPGAPPEIVSATEPLNEKIVSMVRAVDEAIIAQLNGDTEKHLDYSLQGYPDIGRSASQNCPPAPDAAVTQLGPVLFFLPMAVITFLIISTAVGEKENNLKSAMQVVGLSSYGYWIAQFLAMMPIVVLNTFFMLIFGYAFQFTFFANTDFGVLLLLFLLFGTASVAFALFISSVCPSVKLGIGFGFFFIIIGLMFIATGTLSTYVWYVAEDDPSQLAIGWKVFMWFPFFNFGKMCQDILARTKFVQNSTASSCNFVAGPGFKWNDLYQIPFVASDPFSAPSQNPLVPVPNQSLGLLIMNTVLWMLLAMYFDKVVPNENGYAEHPLFFLFPSYYGFKTIKPFTMPQKDDLPTLSRPLSDEDPDVTNERKEAFDYNPQVPDQAGLRMVGLNKTYFSGIKSMKAWFYRVAGKPESQLVSRSAEGNANDKTAVHELSLVVEKGQMLGLLGSNGSGKTSTMKILYGVSPATCGFANIFGMNTQTEMNQIKRNLGVCPQFDLLFPDLTALEHVELFAGIKGLEKGEIDKVLESRLKQVRLWTMKQQRAGTYSGGQKRRLSVILATLGDPKCVFLDEPTTGMDPQNKRYVWTFLEQFKKDRVVVLTTHSMEEADTLCDKIAIMTRGRLKAIGKSIRLKNKYGNGYRVSMIVGKGADVDSVKKMITDISAVAKLIEEEYIGGDKQNAQSSTARLVYEVSSVAEAKPLIQALESQVNSENRQIVSFGLQQTSLEDVFLKTVQQ
ncbi:hypothetical protein MP228_011224 [Amoeboaphelidium protococcarum]|nr:hypothetical protein MP228_011224 [Amoeboaphelidium protococcarum]